MPQLRRPDYQPPQTLAGHITPRGNRKDGRHVTATSPSHNGETGGPGSPPRTPSYRRRTVKGHCEEKLGPGWRDKMVTDLLGNTKPSSLQVRKDAILYLTKLELFLARAGGKCGLLWHCRVCGVSMMDFFFSWVEREGITWYSTTWTINTEVLGQLEMHRWHFSNST